MVGRPVILGCFQVIGRLLFFYELAFCTPSPVLLNYSAVYQRPLNEIDRTLRGVCTMETLHVFVRDAAVIVSMFVLRIGVPLLITLLLGWGLRKLLEEKQEAPEPTQAEEPEPIKLRP